MADDPGFLLTIGVKVPDMLAGFAGGVVNAFVFKRGDPWSVAGSMVVGALTSNYLGEPAAHLLGLSNGPSAFIVGVAGMALCQGIVAAAQNWRPTIPGGGTGVPK